ncbi:MAG TPA: DUF1570 domain-containing protein [Gemmataceae bacterium]|jgi:hypothetical protein
MKRYFLAAAFLLGSAGFASADYVIIVANVGSSKELRTLPGMGMYGMAGMPGMGMAGMRGMAMRGGPPGMPGMGGNAGAGGMPPGVVPPGGNQGAGGAPPGVMPPGMANRGGAAGMAGMQGMPPAMAGMMGAAGMRGGMMGMGGMAGMRGGMMGMAGMPGAMMGMFGGTGGSTDVEDVPYFIIAVVEVDHDRGDLLKKLKAAETTPVYPTIKLTDRLGKGYEGRSLKLHPKPSFGQTIVLTQEKDKPLPSVHHQFDTKYSATFKDKPSADDIVRLAEWALSHGLIEKVPALMDKLVEVDKGHRAAVAYLKVKPELNRPAANDDAALSQIKKLLGGYKEETSPHYTLLHNVRANSDTDVQSNLSQLENTFRGLYYWFALKGEALLVPKKRQVVVVTSSNDDFKRSHKVLTSGPVVVDGFFARRENTSVMSSKRQDDKYDALRKYYQVYEDKGLQHSRILLEKPPKSASIPPEKIAEAQMLALMLRALEKEAELATISHDASRQLLFASGLLPRNVAVPEWILFGMGSFFETPLQSPWPSMGAPSAYYLPLWNDLKGKGFEKTPGLTLRKVVTDAYFRAVPEEGKSGSAERKDHDVAVRRARTAAWSLTYFLATSKAQFPKLQTYFKELSKMPRDIELDDEILLGCFARAFGCVDASNKVDNGKLDRLAREWYGTMDNVHFDSEGTMKKIREVFRDKLKEMQEAGKDKGGQGQVDPRTGFPMQPGGNGRFPQQGPGPGGVVPPGPVPNGGAQGGGNRPPR